MDPISNLFVAVFVRVTCLAYTPTQALAQFICVVPIFQFQIVELIPSLEFLSMR